MLRQQSVCPIMSESSARDALYSHRPDMCHGCYCDIRKMLELNEEVEQLHLNRHKNIQLCTQ